MQRADADREGRLRAAWALISQSSCDRSDFRSSSIVGETRPAEVTLDSEGNKGVLLPLSPGEALGIPQTGAGGGGALRISVQNFLNGHVSVRALHIWCVDRACDAAFTSFILLLFDKAESLSLSEAVLSSREEFEGLVLGFESNSRVITGLVGELMVLRDLVMARRESIRFWGGGRGERHDFRNGLLALEVKTSRRAESKNNVVQISDWDQLDPPDGGALFLRVIKLEQVESGPISVLKLVEEIRGLLQGDLSMEFESRISNYGESVLRDNTQMVCQSVFTYVVDEHFPRLSRDSLRVDANVSGVSDVTYRLDLGSSVQCQREWLPVVDSFIGGDDA